jgi:hypothetical protein
MVLKRKMSVVLACGALLAGLAVCTSPAQAETPETYLELLRSDVRTARVDLLTEALELTAEESELFWPIFREYDTELMTLGDRRVALIKAFLESYDAATDEDVSGFAKEWFALHHDRLKLRKRYFNKVSKAVGVRVATRFVQVENIVGMLIDIQIAAELPLVE